MPLGTNEGGIGQLENLWRHANITADDPFHAQSRTVFGLQFSGKFSLQGGETG